MSGNIWDDPNLKVNDNYIKLENEGETFSGVVLSIRPHRFDDGAIVPQITFTDDSDGQERTWTAGAINARRELQDKRPLEGDHIRVTLTGKEKRAGGKTLKHWDVAVTRASQLAHTAQPTNLQQAVASQPAQPPAWAQPEATQIPPSGAQAAQEQAMLAALNAMSDEEKRRLGIAT